MLNRHKRTIFLLLLLTMTGLLIGCTKKSTPPGANSISNVVEGVRYSYNYWEEGLAILLWHDSVEGGEGCSSTSSTEDPVFRLECQVDARDGASFSYRVHTIDGVTGEMWINEQPYDLSLGGVFLVSTREGDLHVEQINSDLSGLDTAEEIAALAGSDAGIAAFIAAQQLQAEVLDDEEPDIEQVSGLDGFMKALQDNGNTVEVSGSIQQPFFSVPGQVIEVDGQELQVFEYPDTAAAAAEAGQISPTGSSIGTHMVTWIAPPHFYTRDRLIVLYVGEDESTTALLAEMLGEPLAEGQGGMLPLMPEEIAPDQELLELLPGALAEGDSATLEALMGESFIIGYWRSEGQTLSPSEALEQIQLNLLPNPQDASFTTDRSTFPDLDGLDPATMFGPAVKVVELVFSQGWGAGAGEAILVIASNEAGEPYWFGLLYAMDGFSQEEAAAPLAEVVQVATLSQPDGSAGTGTPDCQFEWFMDLKPAACPAEEALASFAAGQSFERGRMIWVEETDVFYILFNAGAHPNDSRTTYRTLSTLAFKPGASADNRLGIQPPVGMQEPVSGFGLLWRGEVEGLDTDLRQALGWAVVQETGFQTMVQCQLSQTYSERTCYLLDADGSVNVLSAHAVIGNVWTKLAP